MENLFDTCTIISKFESNADILSVANFCIDIKEPFGISSVIERELKPAVKLEDAEYEKADSRYTYVWLYIKANKILLHDINADKIIWTNYQQIRKSYYGWMSRPDYIKDLIKQGKLRPEQYHSDGFRHKDEGECSLIAIALSNPDNYTIISEDIGRVFAHSEVNIFDIFRKKGIKIVSYSEWEHCSEINI